MIFVDEHVSNPYIKRVRPKQFIDIANRDEYDQLSKTIYGASETEWSNNAIRPICEQTSFETSKMYLKKSTWTPLPPPPSSYGLITVYEFQP